MTFSFTVRCLILLGLIGIAGLLATGCTTRDPQVIKDIWQARQALDAAKKAGAATSYPDDFKALEKRYLKARSAFYACRDHEASQLARDLRTDARDLADRSAVADALSQRLPSR
jgi:hypothetical protein